VSAVSAAAGVGPRERASASEPPTRASVVASTAAATGDPGCLNRRAAISATVALRPGAGPPHPPASVEHLVAVVGVVRVAAFVARPPLRPDPAHRDLAVCGL